MRIVLGIIQAVLFVAYPLAVYLGLSRFSARGVGLLLLVLLLPGLVRQLWPRRGRLKALVSLPVAVAALIVLAIVFDDERLMLAYPVLVNAVLLGQFGWSLRGSQSMVERFARLQVDDLSEAEIRYCRRVTQAWSAFFVLNGTASALVAIFGSRQAWALYTGLISYLILGVLFAIELTLRKYLFRRYGEGLLDRVFAWLFPPKAALR
jgi:uncharacterized membrane protein